MQTETVKKAFKSEIRLDVLAGVVWKNRKRYLLPLLITFVVALVYVYSLPRYYKSEVVLAPEYSSGGMFSGNSALGGLASMAGLNLGSMTSEDAIQPTLYPDLIGSTDFLVSLFDVKVKTNDDRFAGSLSNYIATATQAPWWAYAKNAVKSLLSKKKEKATATKINPFKLTRGQYDLAEAIKGKIECSVDKKTDVITIIITDNDALVAATLADTVKSRLQDFITSYRTHKARIDMEHIAQLCRDAKEEYQQKQRAYVSFADANQDLVLQSFRSKQDALENEMQLAYNVYSQLSNQLQLAHAKVLERTPAFTTIQAATVPIVPAGPKRMIIVAALLALVFVGSTLRFLFSSDEKA